LDVYTYQGMTYVLAAQRSGLPDELRAHYRRYQAYLAAEQERFPAGAYALATAEWYYDCTDHRCPHDAWLEVVELSEPDTGARREQRTLALRVRLLGAYHDGHVEFRYPKVFAYELAAPGGEQGHGDWLYDEFRLTEAGRLLHEIEWAHGGRWLIEAADVEFVWIPRAGASAAAAGGSDRDV
jgi:hypothetical protein